jgi:hypothetical protein
MGLTLIKQASSQFLFGFLKQRGSEFEVNFHLTLNVLFENMEGITPTI